jgi:hypothetical protein
MVTNVYEELAETTMALNETKLNMDQVIDDLEHKNNALRAEVEEKSDALADSEQEQVRAKLKTAELENARRLTSTGVSRKLSSEMRELSPGLGFATPLAKSGTDAMLEDIDTDMVDQAHEASSLTARDLFSAKSRLTKTVSYVETLVLHSSSHPESSLFQWFTDLQTTVPMASQMCMGYLKLLGQKMGGIMASNHRLALESLEVRQLTEQAQAAFAHVTRLYLLADSKAHSHTSAR